MFGGRLFFLSSRPVTLISVVSPLFPDFHLYFRRLAFIFGFLPSHPKFCPHILLFPGRSVQPCSRAAVFPCSRKSPGLPAQWYSPRRCFGRWHFLPWHSPRLGSLRWSSSRQGSHRRHSPRWRFLQGHSHRRHFPREGSLCRHSSRQFVLCRYLMLFIRMLALTSASARIRFMGISLSAWWGFWLTSLT